MEYTLNKEDVVTVLDSYGIKLENINIDDVMEMMDDDAITNVCKDAKFHCEENGTVQEAFYDEIARQLFQNGYIPKENVIKYGNSMIMI